MKVYGIAISTEELAENLNTEKGKIFLKFAKKAVGVHPDPRGIFQAVLFRTPKERNSAYLKIKPYFKTAVIMAEGEID